MVKRRRFRVVRNVVLGAMTSVFAARLGAQAPSTTQSPDSARLITTDIPKFWRVFDRATLVDAGDLFQRQYIDSGSPGLHDFIPNRIGSGRLLAGAVASRAHFYAAIRGNTLAIDTARAIKDSIRASFRRLERIYPRAKFPNVYFVIGRLNSGGTTSPNGMLIGAEVSARDDGTPVTELTDWERAVTGRISDLPVIVAHELIHIQQLEPQGKMTLLTASLREGAADFIGELISGANTNRTQKAYGDAHEAALWEEFRGAMSSSDLSHWLYQGNRSVDRPADLGYYMGYQICRSYYMRTRDKTKAVADIIEMNDAAAFLAASGYGATSPAPENTKHD